MKHCVISNKNKIPFLILSGKWQYTPSTFYFPSSLLSLSRTRILVQSPYRPHNTNAGAGRESLPRHGNEWSPPHPTTVGRRLSLAHPLSDKRPQSVYWSVRRTLQ